LNKKAFSLIELLLVIILIGLTYSIVLSKHNDKKTLTVNKLENLKTILTSTKNNSTLQFTVYDNCKKILTDSKNKEINIDIKEFQNISVYRTDKNQNLVKITFTPLIQNNKTYDVCFNFNVYKNGSNSSYIIKQNEKYIVFTSFFKSPLVTQDKNEAIDFYLNTTQLKMFTDETL